MFAGDSNGSIGQLSYSTEPAVLIVADNDEGQAVAANVVEAVGARSLGTVSTVGAIERLAGLAALPVVMVEASCAQEDAPVEALVRHLNDLAAEGICRSIVTVGQDRLDAVFAETAHEDVILLCEADAGDRLAALAYACHNRRPAFSDTATEPSTAQLAQLSEEVGRIARALASLAEQAPRAVQPEPINFAPPPPLTDDKARSAAAAVRNIIRARRAREQFFREELFADPAWDMLLDLMAARLEHKRVSVSSLCIAAAVPATTALRWIKTMSDQSILVRRADPTDGRRIFIELSDRTAGAMTAYLDWMKTNFAVFA